ncbi:hypothetical protein BC830DRAFT_33495 [Chytriomyces sp. MP71]|nr:hypothetical protein BC830DRAFT_33495 [Chytriomyces sp. MP71]
MFGACAIIAMAFLFQAAKGSRSLGPLTLTFQYILTNALPRWAFLFILLAFGYIIAINLVVTFPEAVTFGTFGASTLWILRFLMLQVSFSDVTGGMTPAWCATLYITYGFLVSVLLLNVMIALLSETFGYISENSVDRWRLQLASFILHMDRQIIGRRALHGQIVKMYGLAPKKYKGVNSNTSSTPKRVAGRLQANRNLPEDLHERFLIFVVRSLSLGARAHNMKLSVGYDPATKTEVELVHKSEHDWWSLELVLHDLAKMLHPVRWARPWLKHPHVTQKEEFLETRSVIGGSQLKLSKNSLDSDV